MKSMLKLLSGSVIYLRYKYKQVFNLFCKNYTDDTFLTTLGVGRYSTVKSEIVNDSLP